MDERWWVYLVECGDGSLYTGIAVDVHRRVDDHNAGTGARYTRGRGPIELITQVGPLTRGDALRLELRVKRAAREDKRVTLESAAR